MDNFVTGSSSVLVASPFVDERTAYAAALREQGYQLREVADAASLVAAADELPPDLIICEMLLPDEDALVVSRRLRAIPHTAHVPFMIVSGRATERIGAAGVRTPCPTHLVVRQAEKLIALAGSSAQTAPAVHADAERLIAETKRLRDESREVRWRRRL